MLASLAPYLGRLLVFALGQAALSTLLSLVLGVPLALALARRRFPGRGLVLAALSAAAVMPAIVVVFAVTAVYGRAGWLAALASPLGVELPPVYGWAGVVLAHVFLNAPLVARIVLEALAGVPAEHWRLAEALAFRPGQVFRHLDWPPIRAELPGIAGLVFLLCFTSFPIVLALGGGPPRATLEVAIYEALRLEADFARAAWLAFAQVAVCGTLAVLLAGAARRAPAGHTLRLAARRLDADHPGLRRLDGAVLSVGALLVLPPLVAVAVSVMALPAILDRDLAVAVATSLAVGLSAALVAAGLALALAAGARHARLSLRRPRLAALHDALPAILLAVPPFALTAGLYLWLRRIADPAASGLVLLPLLNALAALPFAYRFVAPALAGSGERYGRLAEGLGLSGLARFRIVDWPALRQPLRAALALAAALSLGDFGIVALFGGGELRTLPYLLAERLGAYRVEEAGAVGLVLVLVTVALARLALSRAPDLPEPGDARG